MSQIYLRILGYITTLVLHVGNMTVLMMNKDDQSDNVKIKIFKGMMFRYFTCWTIMLQILYAALSLYCDLLLLKNSKNKKYKIPQPIQGFRNIVFAALVWPCTMVVFTVFWSLYLYDRSLIFPEFIDKVISSTSNHILHTAIVPIVIWEVLTRPRVIPKSHLRNIIQMAIHLLLYMFVLFYTYIREGVWLYPIFHVTYGTIHFVLVLIYIVILYILFYYSQWVLNYVVHGSQDKIKKSNVK